MHLFYDLFVFFRDKYIEEHWGIRLICNLKVREDREKEKFKEDQVSKELPLECRKKGGSQLASYDYSRIL